MSKSSLLLIAATLTLTACSEAQRTDRPLPARTVLVTPVKAPAAPVHTVVGTVRSSRLAIVASEQGGRVVELLADIGSRVTAGQPLARLDPEPARLLARQAAAEFQQAEATAAERALNAARVRTLHADKAASDADLEAALAEARAAHAARDAAAAALAIARRDAANAVLRAPTSGVVAARPAILAAVLAPGAPAFEIEGDGEYRIQAQVPAKLAAALAQGARIPYSHADGKGMARLIGLSARDTGAGGREATFAIVAGTPAPGATVELQLPGRAANAEASIPLAALLKGRGGDKSVQLVDAGNRLREVPVTLLAINGSSAQVAGPLKAGQLVVAAGGEFLEAGITVRPHLVQR